MDSAGIRQEGIITRNDPGEENPIEDISEAVKEARQKQAVLVVFLSLAAMADNRTKRH